MRYTYRSQNDEQTDELMGRVTAIVQEGKSLTQQQFKDDTDLNLVMKRLNITDGAIPVPMERDFYDQPVSVFGERVELRDVLDMQRKATEHFDSLPAQLRKRFDNNPAKMHQWVNDEANTDEAVKIGLLKKATPPVEEPPKTP